LKETFKPEFLNRIDDIVIFNNLEKKEIQKIVDIQIDRLQKRLEANGIQIQLTDRARTNLADIGFDHLFGARPLKRAIQKNIEDPLAEQILDGGVKDGSKVKVDVSNDRFTFL